jgi:oxalate decarboxylase family bicupin protein
MPQFWTSFNLAPKRIQNGGWARQITQDDFKISTTIAGVNMRLGPGGVRELHWHQQAEWAVMTYGNCRVTILDESGRPEVADVKEGDLWYFPAGFPHSLQGLDPDGCEFVIAFDNGDSSEFNTLLVTDWLAHTPPEVLAKNFGQPVEVFKNIPVHNKWIYQSNIPAPPLPTGKWRRPQASHPIRSCLASPMCRQAGRRRVGRCGLPTAPTSLFRKQSPRQWSRLDPAACEICIGILMPMSGTIGSRAMDV